MARKKQIFTKSILTSNLNRCYMCGSTRWIEIHHIYSGAYRNKSTEYGLIVPLCHFCHNEPPNGVHYNRKNMDYLREQGQLAFEREYPNLDFMKIFNRNYKQENAEERRIDTFDIEEDDEK